MKRLFLKYFILTLSMFVFSGCNHDEEKIPKPNDNDEVLETPVYNEELLKHIDFLNFSNYNYEFVVNVETDTFTYQGLKYDNLNKGTYSNSLNNTTINYYISNDICYDYDTKNEITNVFYNINNKYIDFEHIKETINNQAVDCQINNSEFKCLDAVEKVEYLFKLTDNVINYIEINDNINTYKLYFNNINNTDIIKDEFFVYNRFKIDYVINNNITVYDESEDTKIIYYKIDDVEFIVNNTIENIISIKKIIGLAIDTVQLPNNTKKYIYENEFLIIEHKDEITTYYLLTEDNLNELLKTLLKP